MTTPLHHALSRRQTFVLAGGALAGVGAAALGTDASAATPWQNLVVVTANIGREHLDQRERAIAAVRAGVRVGDTRPLPLVGWQEITEGDGDNRELAFIKKHFGRRFTHVFATVDHRAHKVPISVPQAFEVVSKHNTFVHKGRDNVTPHRVISEVVLRSVSEPSVKFAFLNTHYVAGAFNGKKDSHESWRVDMWKKHYALHRDRIEHYRERGLPVVWTGDVNRQHLPKFFRAEVRPFSTGGIDQVGIIPSSNGTEFRVRSTRTIDLHVDTHNARVVVLQVRHA